MDGEEESMNRKDTQYNTDGGMNGERRERGVQRLFCFSLDQKKRIKIQKYQHLIN